jgi:hypothetical protein
MKQIHHRWKTAVYQKHFIISCLIGILLFGASLVINYHAAGYALEKESNAVTDMVLDNIPTYNVDILFSYGPLILVVIIAASCLYEPRRIPLVLKSIAIFIVIRAMFITFTHIGPYPDRVLLDSLDFDWMKTLTSSAHFFLVSSGSDLFFSGHTGMPFLAALIYWKLKPIRYVCLAGSIFFGILALLGHIHYTIDVASAFFITYTIWVIIQKLLPHDVAMFEGKIQ